MDNMSEYGWVENIGAGQLSNRALVLVSRFARILKQVRGQRLDLQDPSLAKKVVRIANETNDLRLKQIFDDLVLEFQSMVERRELSLDIDTQLKGAVSGLDEEPVVRFYRGVPIEPIPRSSSIGAIKKNALGNR